MKDSLSLFNNHPNIWRAREQPANTSRFALGIHTLDEALHGGIPSAGVVSIACTTGIGEVSLFQQVISQQRKHKLRVFINPPAHVCAPWLTTQGIDISQVLIITPDNDADALWAAEQCLKSAACHCVLLWSKTMAAKTARRLQVAATHNDALCLLFSLASKKPSSLPVSLELSLKAHEANLTVDILKQRQGWPVHNLSGPFSWTPDNHAIQWAIKNNKRKVHSLHSVS
jgi:hypothetical protein